MSSFSSRSLTPGQDTNERRKDRRSVTVYRPCCVRAGPRCTAGLIRNLSDQGLMIETSIEAEVGSEIEYLDGSSDWMRARVVWSGNNTLGLETLEPAGTGHSHPRRAVRIPATLLARVWLDDGPVEVGIGNISQKGVLVFGVPPLAKGRLLTLTIDGRDYPQTSVRWWAEGCAGMKLAHPLSMSRLSELVEHCARRAAALRYEGRLGQFLEVKPANDATR
jgi:hypothetical protein